MKKLYSFTVLQFYLFLSTHKKHIYIQKKPVEEQRPTMAIIVYMGFKVIYSFFTHIISHEF